MDQTKTVSFASACKDFFGYKEGEGMREFMAEIKALTDTDRAEIKEGLSKVGYNIQ